MYSGKSTALINEVTRYKIAQKNVVVFKPSIDDRYSETEVVTHTGHKFPAYSVNSILDILQNVNSDVDCIAFDEVQFFPGEIHNTINFLNNQGHDIVCAGLDMDFNGNAFENTKNVMGIADKVSKLKAVCMSCGIDANMSHLKNKSDCNNTIQIGGKDEYSALCRKCWNKLNPVEEF